MATLKKVIQIQKIPKRKPKRVRKVYVLGIIMPDGAVIVAGTVLKKTKFEKIFYCKEELESITY